MKITHHIPENFSKAFGSLSSGIDYNNVKYPKCIAYENLGGDDYKIVYEVYIDKVPRFFYFSNLEAPLSVETELDATKKWAHTEKINLIDYNDSSFLFELSEPFGIYFGTIT